MAARRQPAVAAAAAAASPAGLKIKVKAGVGAPKLSKEDHPQESGEDVGADPGDSVVTNARMLKRKRLTPPGSPTASKRPPRGDSPNPLTANGELPESLPKKIASHLTDLNAVKQDVRAETGIGLLQPGAERVIDERNKAIPTSQGELQVSSAATTDEKHGASSAGLKVDEESLQVCDQLQSVATRLHVSSSLATSSLPTLAEKAKHHTIPSHAGWFSWTEIHTLETRGLPEFFNGKVPGKTPEVYMEYRNSIMKKYREHLGTVITVSDVQERLSGVDEKSIHRVMEFLDHWGLINYQAPAEFLPPWRHPAPILESDATLMLQALPRRGSSLYHFDSSCAPVFQQSLVNPKQQTQSLRTCLHLGKDQRWNIIAIFVLQIAVSNGTIVRNRLIFDLCSDCYNQGQFGPDMVSTDFIKMDVTEAFNANGGGWTDQETLLLLEALELYGDNWNEIAEHVATKSKSQCILHFLRLPVEDPFSEVADIPGLTDNAPAGTPVSQTESTLQGDEEEKETSEKEPVDGSANIPSTNTAVEPSSEYLVMPPNLAAFAEAGNPVMAQMSFLATMIGSKLGGEAAQAALAALTTKDPGVHLAAGTAMILEDPVADVEPSISENPDRSVQGDEEMETGDETTATGDAGPSPSDGVKMPVSDSTTSAQYDNDVPTQPEPNLGKEVVQKTDVADSLNILDEAKVAGRVKRAAASAIAAAAVKAKLLAHQEEREMQRLITVVTDQQLKKLELKLTFLKELEAALGKECESVERDRLNFFADHARIVTSRLGTSSDPLPPSSPSRQQLVEHHIVEHQPVVEHHQPVVEHQPAPLAQRPSPFQGQMYGRGFQPLPHPPSVSSNHQMPNHAAFMQSQMYQGLANSMNAGAMTLQQQSHFGRQMMIAGNAPHMLGRPGGPPEMAPSLGRPLMLPDASGQGLGGALSGLPGLPRPVPGGASGGLPQ